MKLGLQEAFNPAFLAAFFLFFIYITAQKISHRQVIVLGMNFFYSFMISNSMLINGNYDYLLNQPIVLKVIRIFNFCLAVYLFILGAIHFSSWSKIKRTNQLRDLQKPLPKLFSSENLNVGLRDKKKKILSFSFLGKAFFVFLFGIFSVFMGSMLAHDYEIFLYLLKMFQDGEISFNMYKLSIQFYNFCAILPGIVLGIIIVSLMNGRRNLNTFKFVSYYKIISAALFFATSIGLLISYF